MCHHSKHAGNYSLQVWKTRVCKSAADLLSTCFSQVPETAISCKATLTLHITHWCPLAQNDPCHRHTNTIRLIWYQAFQRTNKCFQDNASTTKSHSEVWYQVVMSYASFFTAVFSNSSFRLSQNPQRRILCYCCETYWKDASTVNYYETPPSSVTKTKTHRKCGK